MEKVCFYVLILSFQLVFSHHIPSTPCPGIFDYGSDGTGDIGVIRLRATEQVSYLVLRTNFTIEAELTYNDYLGRLEAQDGDHLLEKYNRGVPVLFRVNFPLKPQLPRITAVYLNGNKLCEGPQDNPHPGGPFTKFNLQFTSYPKRDNHGHVYSAVPLWGDDATRPLLLVSNEPASDQSSSSDNYDQPSSRPIPAQRPPVPLRRPTPVSEPPNQRRIPSGVSQYPRPTSEFEPQIPKAYGCGQVVGGNENVPLIYNGQAYTRGDLPWLVAIYRGKAATLNFICGGTLVSDRHVVTAAHCMHRRSELTSIKDFVVKVGVHDLNSWSDEYTVTRNIAAAYIHEAYNASTLDNDLLVFTFNKPVEFNNYIRPACLWGGKSDLSFIVGASGVVAGWGDQGDPDLIGQGVPHMVHLPIVSNAQCKASKTSFHYITSSKTLCAGDRKGTGPCTGDSGGGLYLLDGGKWRIRGVVSRSLRSNIGDSVCNLNEYVVFTDTAQYSDWIRSIISQNNYY